MSLNDLRQNLRSDLESPPEARRLGSGWLSGTAALIASLAGLFFVLCLRYPNLIAIDALRPYYDHPLFRLALHCLLITAFALALISLVLRSNRILGFTSICTVLLAAILGGSRVESHGELTGGLFLGLDWFVLNVIFTGFLFIPLERLFPRYKDQPLFRTEWREDLFYFLVSSLLVQVLTFLSLAPALTILHNTHWDSLRHSIGAQPVILQILEIMFLTDVVQYWVHRAFHRIPFLWNFHAVHHSATHMDWMAGARMHFIEILVLRGTTVIPMYILGFRDISLYAYVLLVYIHSTFVHSNTGFNFNWLGRIFVTPRFHHWHHGIEKEAIDVNFSIHFPILDRLFGTYHFPKGEWPKGYGIEGHPVPRSYWKQFCYPFSRKRVKNPAEIPAQE
jgi:sterol desaturase/sphingolipid hydroxylase (fatty acid hydroxylase superfamily)